MTYADPERQRATRRAHYAANRDAILEKTRARKRSYGRDCISCGKRTDGSNGRDMAPMYCDRCRRENIKVWTRGTIISAIQLFAVRYGAPPTAKEWNPPMARRDGRDDWAHRFHADGDYPLSNTVQSAFGSWNAAIEAAGFEPRGIGKRGPAKARL